MVLRPKKCIARGTVQTIKAELSAMPIQTVPEQGGQWAFTFLVLFTIADFARPEDIFRIPFHFQLIFGVCAALAYIAALLARRVRLFWSRELILVVLLTIWFTLGVPFAYWRRESFEVLTQVWLKTLLSFFLLSQMLTSQDRIKKLLWAIILSELLVTSLSIAMSGRADLRVGDRLSGISAGLLAWNYFGIAVAQICPYVGALYLFDRSKLKTGVLLVSLLAMMWMLVLTASRGGFLNVVFSIVLTWWLVLRGSARGRIACAVLVVCLLICVAGAPGVFFVRVQTIWKGSNNTTNDVVSAAEESTRGRQFLLDRAISYTLRYPIFGVGLGNFADINGTELARPDAWYSTHNTFTQISSEAGIPALILFLFLLAAVVSHMRQMSRAVGDDRRSWELRLLARATLASTLSLAFGWFFANLAYDRYSYYSAGIATGLWIAFRQLSRVGQVTQSQNKLYSLASATLPLKSA